MKIWIILLLLLSFNAYSESLPTTHKELIKYIQPAPDQGDTKSCWFMASTGAMELLLNKRDKIENPEPGGPNDLSEAFLIWQKNFKDPNDPATHYIESLVMRFNHGEAVHVQDWPFVQDMTFWDPRPDFATLPRMTVPAVTTEFLFSRGERWSTHVLTPDDVQAVKKALVKYNSPVIINYNDNDYWHVILIVGYNDEIKGSCYEIKPEECNKKGAFYVRDSNGNRYNTRAYNWFQHRANAAAVVRLKE